MTLSNNNKETVSRHPVHKTEIHIHDRRFEAFLHICVAFDVDHRWLHVDGPAGNKVTRLSATTVGLRLDRMISIQLSPSSSQLLRRVFLPDQLHGTFQSRLGLNRFFDGPRLTPHHVRTDSLSTADRGQRY